MINRETGVFKRTYAEDLAVFRTPLPKAALAVVAVLVFVVVPWAGTEYWLGVLNLIGIAALGALGLNILVGYTGQISVGHAAFMSVGAYTAAVILREFPDVHWLAAMLAGGCAAALAGMFFGIPSLRIKGLYLAVSTLAAQLIIEWGINHWPWLSGGAQGSVYVERPTFPWVRDGALTVRKMESNLHFYYLIYAVLAIGVLFALNLFRSHLGRAFVAVRDRDVAAEIIGINIFLTKLKAFGIASFYAGVTGVLYTYFYGIANFESFTLLVSIQFLAMCIVGGLGSVLGSILGAAFITMLPIALDFTLRGAGGALLGWDDAAASAIMPQWNLILFGGLIMFFLVVEPDGLAKMWRNFTDYFRVWPFPYL